MTTATVVEFELPAFRLWTARPRRGSSTVRRPALVQQLADPSGPPLTVLVAPAGYGKTTLLREWARHDPRPFAWVTVGPRGDDGELLRERVALAIDEAIGDDPDAAFVLVVDDAHALTDGAGLDALAAIADDLPPCARLAVASRRRLALPVARLRAQRLVTELGPRELAMSRAEASALLADAGHRLDPDDLDSLVRRTEGWPVGLTLAALYLGDRGSHPNLARFSGSDRLVADYVRDELLNELSPAARAFAVRTSVAETLTASLCDALLGRADSASTLESLARDGIAIPVDRAERQYRYHRLVRDTLRTELRHADPQLEPELQRRASAWHRTAGDLDRAVLHALAAGDARVAGDLVWRNLPVQVAAGQIAVVERWLSRFTEGQLARQPRLALAAAGCELVRGQGDLAQHWAAVAADAPRPAGARGAVEIGVALLHAAIGAHGPARMRDDAAAARALLPAGAGAGAALAGFLEGAALHLVGERDAARQRLEEGAREAAVRAPHLHALCLSELAALALDRSDWDELTELSTRARGQADRHGLRTAPVCALVFAVSAVARAQRGRIEEAQADVQDATRLLGQLTDFPAWYRAEVHIMLARAALRLSDVCLARAHVKDATRLVARRPDAVALTHRLADAVAQLEAFTPPDWAQPAPMTAAELRVLRFLPTHLSFREIAERTQVSANTVKTQANAVYRKFGVACRSDAVSRARSCGLLD